MKRKISFAFLCVFFLSGCWDRHELKEIGTVVAVGLDKDPHTGNIEFTSQIIRPSALSKDSASKESPIEIVSSNGKTVFEAIRNAIQKLDRKYVYSHTKLIVISEELAKEGVLPFLDLFTREREMRGYTLLAVAKGETKAKEILGVKSKIENIQASYLKNLIENKESHAQANTSDVITYYINSLENGIEPVIGVLKITEEESLPVEDKKGKTTEQIKFSGVAAFKDDKLAGFLNEKETQGFNWIIGDVNSRVITMDSMLEEDKLISIEVIRANSQIESKLEGDSISFTIHVEQEGALVEQQSVNHLKAKPKKVFDYLKKVEDKNEEVIKEEIETTMNKVQGDLQTDILGFGQALQRKYPKKWNEVKGRWNELFPTLDYEVKVTAKIIKTNLKSGTYQLKD